MLQPDTETGDIVFVVQLKDHSKFKRKGDDLFIDHSLTLTEALCGFQFALTHLDGRQLLIKANPGEVIKPGMTLLTYKGKERLKCTSLFGIKIVIIMTVVPVEGTYEITLPRMHLGPSSAIRY